MLASFSQFIRDTGNNLKPVALFSDSDAGPQPAQSSSCTSSQDRDKASSPETDIASATTSVTEHDEPLAQVIAEAEAKAVERRRRKANVTYETFIVVRPPPAVSNHPLNLQLQLVPPSNREQQSRHASGSTTASSIRPTPSSETLDQVQDPTNPAGAGTDTQRSPSLRSNRSVTSLYSSASINSTTFSLSSGASTSSTTRRIIPLYNLSAHNVMTNTVTDAGTDAKVAKFGKRGIEIIGLGVLECFEVYGVTLHDPSLFMGTDPMRLTAPAATTPVQSRETSSIRDQVSERSARSSLHEQQLQTPSSSTSNLYKTESQAGDNTATPTAHSSAAGGSASNQPAPSTPTPSSAKKIFGKMFKRAATPTTNSPATPKISGPITVISPTPTTPTPSTPTFPTSISSSLLSPTPAASSSSTSIFSRKQRQQPSDSHKTTEPSIPEDPLDALTAAGNVQAPCLGTQVTLLHRSNWGGKIVPHSAITALNNKASKAGDRSSLQLNRTRSKTSLSDRLSVDHDRLYPVVSPQSVGSSSSTPGISPLQGGFRKTSHSYEWVIRKWTKGADGGLFGIKEGLLSAKSAVFAATTPASANPDAWSTQEVEVRFEWTKGKGSAARARDKVAKLRLQKGVPEDEMIEEEGVEDGRAKLGRGRPESAMPSAVGGDSDPFFVAGSGSGRPTSMVAQGSMPSSPAKSQKRQSMRATPTTQPQLGQDLTRSPSPVRPSIDSSSRRSSDESVNLIAAASTSAPALPTSSSTVYKGKREKERRDRRGSVVEDRDPLGGDDDLDNPDSDPEDSETPWTCTLYVGPPIVREVLPDPFASASEREEKRKGGGHKKEPSITGSSSAFALGSSPAVSSSHARISTSASAHQLAPSSAGGGTHRKAVTDTDEYGNANGGEKKGIRIKLGALTPAPYHPKVVSQLRMPFPVPDINVRRMEILKPGEAFDRSSKNSDMILTMEEIKDVVCVTGLWLVVREGFGGLERRRKGDGWKIRG